VEKDSRKFVKLGSLAITVPTPRNLIFLYHCESAISRVGHTSADTERLIFGERGIPTTAKQGDAGAKVSRESATFPLEAHAIIAMIY
jgi:hypothetical protein